MTLYWSPLLPNLAVDCQKPPWGPTYSKSVWCSSTLVSSYCSNKEKGSAGEREEGVLIESERSEKREEGKERTADKNGGQTGIERQNHRDVGTHTIERQKKKRERVESKAGERMKRQRGSEKGVLRKGKKEAKKKNI